MREKYESMPLVKLRELAKSLGLRGISTMKKGNLIDLLVAQDGTAQEKDPGDSERDRTPSAKKKPAPPDGTDSVGLQEQKPEAAVEDNKAPADLAPAENAQPAVQSGSGERNTGVPSGGGARNAEPASGGYVPRAPQDVQRRNIVRTPDRRDNGRGRRDNGYTYTRSGAGISQRREASPAAEKRANYAADRNDGPPFQERTQAPERRNVSQEPERREIPVQEAMVGADASADRPPMDLAQLDSGISVGGILEVMQDGYGFIRSDNYLPGDSDVYVSPSQIRRFGLKTGDIITGNTRIKSQQEKFSALLYLKMINGMVPSEAMKRYNFEDMTPIFPNERLRMERGSRAVAMRIVDLFSPIGKGQRGMIVSPPKAGKTTLLKDVARSILQNDPHMKLLILLIDERPEEVTDIKESICGENVEVIYSTFDELPEHHKRVSEMVIERAKRLVEHKENVTILLDSITRLARAYNLTVSPSGRTLSGGLDPAALHMPKRFFGAARKMREGGSLTILATALVDTGSKMDDVVYEEFKGTGNMELVLDRKLSEKRVFPAVDIPKSGTRRDDLLLDRDEQEAVDIMRRALNGMKSDEAVENILNMFVHTRDNRELVARIRRQKFI